MAESILADELGKLLLKVLVLESWLKAQSSLMRTSQNWTNVSRRDYVA